MKVEANGISMGYDLEGPVDAPVVTMSHSLAANRDMWWPQMDALRKNYRVLRYDTRGHGESGTTNGPYSFTLLVDDVIALLDKLNVRKTHFVGLSMGGMIGQLLAAKHSNKLHSVTLCATACQMPNETLQVWDERIQLVKKHGMNSISDGTLQRWFTESYLANIKAEVERVQHLIETTPSTGYAACAQAIKKLDQLQDLARISAPTLILVGADDPSTPPAASEVIYKHVTHSKMEVVAHASHFLNVEQSKHFNEALLTFLNNQKTNKTETDHAPK